MNRLNMRRAERVLVFADQPDWHVRSLVRAFRSAGAECAAAGLGAAGFAIGEDGRFDLPGVQGELPNLVFVKGIAAGSFEQVTMRLGLLHALGSVGVTTVNTARAIERCVDKSATSFVLAEAGVPTPPAWASQSPEQAAAILERETAAGHELVLKPLFGAQGRGLRRLRADDSLPPPDEVQGVYYLQRFVTVDGKGWRDWRVLVSGGRAVAAMIRHGSQWITNVRQGARCERVAAKGDLADIAIAAARAVGAHYAGVDLIRDAAGLWLVLEVNSMPAWKGLQGVTPFKIAPRLAEDALGLLAAGRKRTRGRAA